ncbi:hypothetical protein RFI_25502 [Reticulomyxa filosa]|uniref:Uncharacterized protein n=1 Tax=Reticulomyxa filosa TaxID=46433 RepID=X6MDE3_RETFI|nr:hypothetical protein RFI_25502 [Reticulomyxa filosa]|eukprot:ETO11874.1 hypothetical protein RFI_25502 [Reticulomyxa filosa]
MYLFTGLGIVFVLITVTSKSGQKLGNSDKSAIFLVRTSSGIICLCYAVEVITLIVGILKDNPLTDTQTIVWNAFFILSDIIVSIAVISLYKPRIDKVYAETLHIPEFYSGRDACYCPEFIDCFVLCGCARCCACCAQTDSGYRRPRDVRCYSWISQKIQSDSSPPQLNATMSVDGDTTTNKHVEEVPSPQAKRYRLSIKETEQELNRHSSNPSLGDTQTSQIAQSQKKLKSSVNELTIETSAPNHSDFSEKKQPFYTADTPQDSF